MHVALISVVSCAPQVNIANPQRCASAQSNEPYRSRKTCICWLALRVTWQFSCLCKHTGVSAEPACRFLVWLVSFLLIHTSTLFSLRPRKLLRRKAWTTEAERPRPTSTSSEVGSTRDNSSDIQRNCRPKSELPQPQSFKNSQKLHRIGLPGTSASCCSVVSRCSMKSVPALTIRCWHFGRLSRTFTTFKRLQRLQG